MPQGLNEMLIGDVVWNKNVIVMRTKSSYISVLQKGPTMLSNIISELVLLRKKAKNDKDEITAWTFEILLVSIYGAMESKHGIMSSKTCAEATTRAAMFFLKNMIAVTVAKGYKVIYGDTDSIFAWVEGSTEIECMNAAEDLKGSIDESTSGTPFRDVGADIKGNYKSILITARKKYAVVDWHDIMETKGMTPVKKDTLPIARYAASKILSITNSDMTHEAKKGQITKFLGRLFNSLDDNVVSPLMQVTEVRVNCQPHYKYKDEHNRYTRTILVDTGFGSVNVDKEWVKARVIGSVATILDAVEMGSVNGLIFSYNSMVRNKGVRKAAQ